MEQVPAILGTMISDRYNPKEVEKKVYQDWIDKGCFKADDQSSKPPFCVILPPPNVTGFLHIGHALDHTIQDVLVRYKRMSGFNTLWLPGTDHAGIATQSVVEKKLRKEGISKHDLGREKFVEKIWDWKNEYGDRIVNQMKSLGDSCDWDRLTFTLDENVSKAVRKVFVALHKKGFIYKAKRLVNWSSSLKTAISDIEVEHKEIKGNLWHIKYTLASDESQSVTVATTRPETLLGDSAVCVHPEDERYTSWVGKAVKLPLTGREVPVIADDYVDKEFGSGVVKITPAHDFNDYEMGKRHDLEFINILNPDGTIIDGYGEYSGLKVQAARKQVIKDLEEQGLLIQVEPHKHSVGHCERSGVVIEPYLSEQWYVKMKGLAEPAVNAVINGTTEVVPENWTKTYLNWMNNIEDWCVSRQLWWGHQIPVWTCEDCNNVMVEEVAPTVCKCGSKNLVQDSDVLDTWFSSALWPFSTLGWPEDSEALKTFYPTDVLVTGHDIIFFWVARMMMQGLEFMEGVPFKTVYLHGLIRDSQGRKMSKSLGNSVDPVEMIDKYGADALRITLMSQLAAGRDIKFSEPRLEGYRNFMNKIWNSARFVQQVTSDLPQTGENTNNEAVDGSSLGIADQWILFKLKNVIDETNNYIKQYRFSEALQGLYQFVWNDYCDWYIEFSKSRVKEGSKPQEKAATQVVLKQVLNRILRLLHPYIPFITEELYSMVSLPDQENSETCTLAKYPTLTSEEAILNMADENSFIKLELIKEVITAVRNVRGENRIKVSEKLDVHMVPMDTDSQKVLEESSSLITGLARLSSLSLSARESLSKCALTPVQVGSYKVEVVVPLDGIVDIEEEIKRITKNIEKLSQEKGKISGKLNNKNYVKNAPDDLVEQDRLKLTEVEEQLSKLEKNLERLKS